MRVLAIDPALRNTGFAVIEKTSASKPAYRALTYGVLRNHRDLRQSGCLLRIREGILDVIRQYSPEVCAVEGIIYVQSYKTAITMGAARGAAIIAAAEHGLEVYEYAPRRVKQAVVGKGGAAKEQVAFMMRALLGLTETPSSDAADALAIGLAHCYAQDKTRARVETDPPVSL